MLLLAWLVQAAAPAGAESTASPPRASRTQPQDAAASGGSAVRPGELGDLDAWLEYRRAARIPALPLEARIFYRRARIARDTGNAVEALRLARGAAELDPTYLNARLALIGWESARDPAQAMAQASSVMDLVRRDFATQWSVACNGLYLVVEAWLLALLAMGVLILITHNGAFRHAVKERIGRWASPVSGSLWAIVLLIAPFLLGLGLVLPLVTCLGILWPGLKLRERAAVVLLVATLLALPVADRALGRLALPMNDTDAPIAALLPLETQPDDRRLRAVFSSAAERHVKSPFVSFGQGWLAQHDGDWPAAEQAYRATLQAWQGDDHVLDNLGFVLSQQGRREEALESYQKAVHGNPNNAVAWFNLSQAHVQGYEFDEANRAMTRASALDFDRVREFKNQPAHAGALAPVAEWLSPRRTWDALASSPEGRVSHPPLSPWRRLEPLGERLGWLPGVAAVLGIALGMLLHRGLPLHRCGNCDRVVCRRCSERRRAQALCRACARVAASASSPDFARILLERQRVKGTRPLVIMRTVVATLVPSAGLVMQRRVWRALVLLFLAALVVMAASPSAWPYAGRPRFGPPPVSGLVTWAPLLGVYVLSLWGFAAERHRSRTRKGATGPGRSGATVRLREAGTETARSEAA